MRVEGRLFYGFHRGIAISPSVVALLVSLDSESRDLPITSGIVYCTYEIQFSLLSLVVPHFLFL